MKFDYATTNEMQVLTIIGNDWKTVAKLPAKVGFQMIIATNNSVEPVGYKLFCDNAKFNMISSQTSNRISGESY